MTQPREAFDLTAQARTATAAMASAFLAPGTEALLRAQAGFIAAAEDWLHRRREAISDAQHLVARLRASRDVAGVLQAQQDWVAGTVRRFTEDAAAAMQAAERASSRARFTRTEQTH